MRLCSLIRELNSVQSSFIYLQSMNLLKVFIDGGSLIRELASVQHSLTHLQSTRLLIAFNVAGYSLRGRFMFSAWSLDLSPWKGLFKGKNPPIWAAHTRTNNMLCTVWSWKKLFFTSFSCRMLNLSGGLQQCQRYQSSTISFWKLEILCYDFVKFQRNQHVEFILKKIEGKAANLL